MLEKCTTLPRNGATRRPSFYSARSVQYSPDAVLSIPTYGTATVVMVGVFDLAA